MKRTIVVVLAACGIAILAGCGAGGGAGAAGQGRVAFFVTDGFREDYSQVWITLHKMEASEDGVHFHALFDDSAGRVINASTLNGTATLLNVASVPAGTITTLRATIEDHITLVSKDGANTQSAPVDDSVAQNAGGKSVITFPASLVVTPGQTKQMAADFDLPGFTLVGGKVRPHMRRADDAQLEQEAKEAELRGTVSNLSAGGFDLQFGGAQSTHIITTQDTQLVSRHNGGAFTLANGQSVEVKGAVDPATLAVTADRIKLEDGSEQGPGNNNVPAEAKGSITSIDAATGSFTLTLDEADGFMPGSGSINVTTTAQTVFDQRHHGSASLATLTAGTTVEAMGTYDPSTNTLSAVQVEIR